MSTQNVPIVRVSVTVPSRDVEREEEKRRESNAQKRVVISDSFENGEDYSDVAATAEANSPGKARQAGSKDRHPHLKEARSSLLKTIHKTGIKPKANSKEIEGEKILEVAEQATEKVEQEIAKLEKNGKAGLELEHLLHIRQELQTSVQSYQGSLNEMMAQNESIQESPTSESIPSQTASPEEESLWVEAAAILDDGPVSERDVEKFQKSMAEKFSSQIKSCKVREKELATRGKEIIEKLKTASPEEKVTLQKELEEVKKEVKELSEKQKILYQKNAQGQGIIDRLVAVRAKRELGLTSSPSTPPPPPTHPDSPPNRERGREAGLLGVASVTSDKQSSRENHSSLHISTNQETPVNSANSEDGPEPLISPATNDFSGTFLSIASNTSNLRQEAKKTDKMIEQLLRAALSGNWEAIKTALILLDKKASTIMVGIGTQTVKSMQYYEQQMNALSNSLGSLKAEGNSNYQSQLSLISNKMNQYSLNRQAIANFLRDTLSMREEIANLTSSVLQKDGQIKSSISRG